jgi:hypothetical protein
VKPPSRLPLPRSPPPCGPLPPDVREAAEAAHERVNRVLDRIARKLCNGTLIEAGGDAIETDRKSAIVHERRSKR